MGDTDQTLMTRVGKQEDKGGYERPTQIRRGDGIADFIMVKTAFYKCRDDVTDVEKRVKSLEELFHKQSIIQSSNEIVTTASLQNYLDALTMHIERQFQEKVTAHNEQVQRLMATQMEEIKVMIKEKAGKHRIDRQITHVTELVTNNAMRLNSIFTGLEMSIAKSGANKAEMADLEILEKSKADVSEVKRLDEKIDRMEKLVEEKLRQLEKEEQEEEEYDEEEEESEEDEDEDIEDFDDLVDGDPLNQKIKNGKSADSDHEEDPEELKDKINDDDLMPSPGGPGSRQINDGSDSPKNPGLLSLNLVQLPPSPRGGSTPLNIDQLKAEIATNRSLLIADDEAGAHLRKSNEDSKQIVDFSQCFSNKRQIEQSLKAVETETVCKHSETRQRRSDVKCFISQNGRRGLEKIEDVKV